MGFTTVNVCIINHSMKTTTSRIGKIRFAYDAGCPYLHVPFLICADVFPIGIGAAFMSAQWLKVDICTAKKGVCISFICPFFPRVSRYDRNS